MSDSQENYLPIRETAEAPVGGGRKDPIATPVVVDAPTQEAQPYLEVVAPTNLPEGYTFDVESNGQTFSVTVPEGGVTEGQMFSVPLHSGSLVGNGAAVPRVSVPVGHWKDGLCDCFQHGVVHSALWNAWCCPLILVGQVMQRLKLTWLGREGTLAETTATFHILLRITVAYYLVDEILHYLEMSFHDEYGNPTSAYAPLVYTRASLNVAFAVYTMVLVAKTRKRIREKYSIPEENCKGCEDCCCAYWCTCCTVAQIARHTADYNTYPGLCCSETGMPPNAPSIV